MSNFPNAIDTDLEIPRIDDEVTEISGDTINPIRDAIFNIESAIGVDPQGNMSSLVERINQVIDEDGNIKVAALSAHALVTLPIINAQIGASAGIEESKLDLDYGTATLNARISSTNINVANNTTQISAVSSNLYMHTSGATGAHDGYDVSLLVNVKGEDDVESALHALDTEIDWHKTSGVAHHAHDIPVTDNFERISATDVQDALEKLAVKDQSMVDHQDFLHTTAVSMNARGEIGKFGNLKTTTLASTIYQTDIAASGHILQVMRPTAIRVTGGQINFGGLSASTAFNLRVQAGGIGRTYIDLSVAAAIPQNNLDSIVEEINKSARTSHYPISAYNTEGRLTIAHNLVGFDYTIEILSSVTNSAHIALGFAGVADTTMAHTVWPFENYNAYIGGEKVVELKSLIKMSHTLAVGSATIALGLGNLNSYGLTTTGNAGKILAHITNHSSTPADNGTYYIIAYPTTATFTLNAPISAGTFDIEIASDSVAFESAANGELFDIFLEYDSVNDDGYATISKTKRISYVTHPDNVDIKSITEIFPTTSVNWILSSGTTLKIQADGINGDETEISTGFRGQLRVFDPDNVGSILVEVTGNLSASATRLITVTDFSGTDDRLYLSSVHHSGNPGNGVLKYVTDKRDLGGTVEAKRDDRLSPLPVTDAIDELRNNGVIRGFDVISNTATTIRLRGGRAVVDGKILDVDTTDITVNDFTGYSKILLLDRNGSFKIVDYDDPGFTMTEITAGDSYGDHLGIAPLVEFGTTATQLDSTFIDRRLIIANIDKKLHDVKTRVDYLENAFNNSTWGNLIAISNEEPDEYIAMIQWSDNDGFDHIDQPGFRDGAPAITSRRFELFDGYMLNNRAFNSPGMTHLNVMIEVKYADAITNQFKIATNRSTDIYIGLVTRVGNTSVITSEEYAKVKTATGTLSSNLIERYMVSIPVSLLSNMTGNILFKTSLRVKIVGSDYIADDGAVNAGEIRFSKLRIIKSNYSIAGDILTQDGSTRALATTINDVL